MSDAHKQLSNYHDPAPERPDKCPTCGIAREHDGPHYRKALKQAGKPMCPDPWHAWWYGEDDHGEDDQR